MKKKILIIATLVVLTFSLVAFSCSAYESINLMGDVELPFIQGSFYNSADSSRKYVFSIATQSIYNKESIQESYFDLLMPSRYGGNGNASIYTSYGDDTIDSFFEINPKEAVFSDLYLRIYCGGAFFDALKAFTISQSASCYLPSGSKYIVGSNGFTVEVNFFNENGDFYSSNCYTGPLTSATPVNLYDLIVGGGYHNTDYLYIQSIIIRASSKKTTVSGNNSFDITNFSTHLAFDKNYSNLISSALYNHVNSQADKIYNEGLDIGYNNGYDLGHTDGYNSGYDEGYDKGFDEVGLLEKTQELEAMTDKYNSAKEGLENTSAIGTFFQGIYEAISGVLGTFFDLELFGMSLGQLIAILLGAVSVIVILKLIF